ncbi:MAG: CdaR family protein [bacterium]
MRKLFSIFEKIFITPISRFIYFFKKKINKSRGWFDKLINNGKFLMYLSLAFAVVVFLLIDYKVLNLVETQYDVIPNEPVIVNYNSVSYVVEGIPETVDITITGRRSDIYLAKQLADYQVVLDLTNYEPSDNAYKINFKYVKYIDNVTYSLSPSYATVVIKEKVSEVRTLTYDLLNIDTLSPELNVANVTLEKTEVVVKSSQDVLDEISAVKALINLEGQNLTKTGTYDINDVKLVAYDNAGNIMDNVEIVPSVITAQVELDSYSKSVELEVSTTGTLTAGKAISSIQINGSDTHSLKVYGDKDDLELLTSIPVTIDVDGLGNESSKTFNVSVSKPTGVRYIDGDTITITVTFADEAQNTLELGDATEGVGLADGLVSNIISKSDVQVQVKGVKSIIDKITSADLEAYVDLTGLKEGTHEVDVNIVDNNPLVTFIVTGKITIQISK